MGNLIRNEWMKLTRHWSAWVMIALLLISVVIMSVVVSQGDDTVTKDWQSQVSAQIRDAKKALKDPRISDSMILGIQQDIAKKQYAIDHNIPPNEITGMSFTRYSSGLIIEVAIFTVLVAGAIVSSEFSWGTIRLLAVRPVSRTKLLLAKYLATLSWGVFLLLVLFVSTYVLGGVLFGFAGADHAYLYVDQNGVHEMTMSSFTLLTYGLQSISVLLYTTVAFLISTLIRSQVIAVPLAVILLFAGNAVYPWLTDYAWDRYFLFTNLDLMQYYDGAPAIPDMTMGFSLQVLAVYFVVLLVGSWYFFVKRDWLKERVNF